MEDSQCKTEDSGHQEGAEDSTRESASPCPVFGGWSEAPEGGKDANWSTVADGQPPFTVPSRYMPREVPPRFRNQQEPKVLLKRGQPPLSCMLLGGASGRDASPRIPLQEHADTSDSKVDSVSLHSSSDASATPTYANYTWGRGSGGQASSQGMDKDSSDVEKWPRPEDSWNSDQTLHSARLGMDESADLQMDSSSKLSEHAEDSASLQSEKKESIKGVIQNFSSKVSPLSGDQGDTQGLNPNYTPVAPDGDLSTNTASEESSPTPLSPAHALYQTLLKREEPVTGDWAKPGPNGGAASSMDLWGTVENPAVKSNGGSSGDGTSQGVWDGDAVGSYKQAATGRTSDFAVGKSKEDMSEEVSTESLHKSPVFGNNVASGDDNQKVADACDGSKGKSASSEDAQNLVQSPSTCHPEEALQSMINHTNLDPKVLCNTGWGKTQIKQNVAWDFEADVGNAGWDLEVNTEHSKEGWRETGDLSNSKMQKQEVGHVGRAQGWTERGEMSVGIGHKASGWGEDQEGASRREGTGWSQGGGKEWTPVPDAGGWKEEKSANQNEGSWGSPEDSGPRSGGWDCKTHQGWSEKLPSQIPNKQTALKTQNQQPQQQSQTQQQMPGYPKVLQDRGRTGENDEQSKGSGWSCGPIPQIASAGEPSGWEEPSPQSISRKMDIDDGTSAWGDPSRYSSKNVNLWDKNSSQPQQQSSGRPAGTPSKNSGPAIWTRSSGPSDSSMESGPAPWVKSFDGSSGWGESNEPGKGGWGNSHSHPNKTGSKSMQEGWGDEGSNSSRHSSWEEEDGGVWGGRGSQSNMSSSYSSGGWGQSQGSRRLSSKSPLKGNSGDSWVSPVSRQFSNMGVTDDDSSMGHDNRHDRRGVNDGEMRRGGRTGGAFRSQTAKETSCGESGPYLDKVGGHGMFGGGIPPMRGMHQAGVHPLNPSPGIRAQVPHQFLPPQVPGPMLKPMAPPSGGMFPPQLSPQHIAMLGGINPHMQQFQLACQLLLQQQQQQQQFLNQRKFSPPLRQQHDPQQLARIMAILQQQQQQGVVGPKLSPSPLSAHIPKHPDTHLHHLGLNTHKPPEAAVHAAIGGSELHNKAPAAYTGAVKLPDGSSFSQYDVLGSGWHRSAAGKVDASPSPNPSWPPEFQPGVPWKGLPSHEPDPYMTPAGMLGSSLLSDTEHHLLQDNTGSNSVNTCMPSPGAWPYSASDPPLTAHGTAKYTELKSSWPPEPIGHSKSWRTNRNASQMPRPPPGLSSQKQPWVEEGPRMARAWGGGASGTDTPFKSEWSDGGASAGKSWLLLRNLTPQIDGSTLRTICLQHGPLLTFHLGLTQGSALIRYCSPHEAAKAQSALHMCVLGNTTILAEFMSEEDVIRYFTHSQAAGVAGSPEVSPGSDSREGERAAGVPDGDTPVGWQGLDGAPGSTVEVPGLAILSQWSNNAGEGAGKGVWGGVAPGYHGGSLWGAPQLEDGTAGLLPGNLLGGGTDSL